MYYLGRDVGRFGVSDRGLGFLVQHETSDDSDHRTPKLSSALLEDHPPSGLNS